jgi:hypothetical protein
VILLESNILGFTSFGYIRIEINVRQSNVTPPLKELYFGDHKDFVLRINGNNFEIGSKLKNGQYMVNLTNKMSL